jgi:protein required for attachment to host cells
MKNTWIVVANASRGRVFSTEVPRKMDNDDDLQELACFDHPESRQKLTELTADIFGRHSQGAGHGSGSSDFIPKSDARDQEKIIFAKEIASVVNKSLENNTCQQVVLVMPPEFYGHFKAVSANRVQENLLMHISKDYTTSNKHELRVLLLPHLSI